LQYYNINKGIVVQYTELLHESNDILIVLLISLYQHKLLASNFKNDVTK